MVNPRTKVQPRATTHAPPSPPQGRGASPAHAGELRELDEERLAALLTVRPDLAVPAPASIEEVEARAFSVPSVLRALLEADASVLQLVQIFTIVGEKHARLTDVRDLAGDGTEPALHEALSWLMQRHLVAPVCDGEICVHPAFLSVVGAAALGPPAAGLVERLSVSDLQSILRAIGRKASAGRKAALVGDLLAFLADGDAIRDLVDGAPAEVRALARNLATTSASVPLPWDVASGGYRRQGASVAAPATWLLQHGLAYRDTWMTALMPREVGLALRGGYPFPPDSYRRPSIEVVPLAEPSPSAVEDRAVAVTQAVERIVECLGSRPAPVLKSGGMGVREVRRLAADIEVSEQDAFRLVEVAAAAGLIVDDSRRGSVLPTPAADQWLDLGVADRWRVLGRGWLEMAVHASLAGAVDSRGKAIPALEYVPDTAAAAPAQRRGLLRLVLEVRNASVDAATSLAAVASWEAPLAWSSDVIAPAPLIARWVLSEMELLGLAVEGAPTALARALVDDDAEGARRLLANPGVDAWQMVLQADLTALAAGRVPPQVRAELTLLADVEGRGSATVYRFSEGSVRRAFDAGRTGEEILDFLNAHAAKGVPQALAYLVDDVERRHGHMRVGRATCYVRFDDPVLATEVLRAKKTVKLGLRQIAPTVLVSDSPQQSVLRALRGCGYLPVAESEDGTAVHTTVAPERAQPGRGPGLSHAAGPDRCANDEADRWGLRSHDRNAPAGDGAHRCRALAAALLGSADGTSQHPARRRPERFRPGATSRIEIPTVLRRPSSSGREPEGLFDALGLDGAGFGVLADEGFDDEGFDDEEHWERSERPSEILRAHDAIFQLLQLAEEEGWLVRISYTSGAGKTIEVTVDILDVSDRVMLAQVAPRWTEQKYLLERIGWARVLTEAEEELVR